MTKRSHVKGSAKPPGVYTHRGSRACGSLVNAPESSSGKNHVDATSPNSKQRVIVSEAQRVLEEKGVSLAALAKITGKTRQGCGRWMRGQSKPTPKDQEKIAAKFPEVAVNLWTLMPRFPEQNCLHPSDDEPKEPTPAKATELKDLTARDGALAYLLMIQDMRAAEAKRKGTSLLKLIEIERRALLDFAKFNGELSATEESRLTETKRWAQLRAAISKTLAKFPDAARAVAEALREINVS